MKKFKFWTRVCMILVIAFVLTSIAMGVLLVIGDNVSNYYNHIPSMLMKIFAIVMIVECVAMNAVMIYMTYCVL